MMHPSQQPRLPLKLLSQTLIGKQRLFQRNRGIKPLIQRFINGAHTTLPKLPDDAIAAL
jgi:hypothetical protein